MSCSSSMALSPAIIAAVRPPSSHDHLSTSATIISPLSLFASQSRIKLTSSKRASKSKIRCDVAVKSADPSEEQIEAEALAKVGSRVKVTAPLKVYHVNRVPEVELEGMEGKLKDYVAVWKGKRISANLPYKVEFVIDVEGRGAVKFVAHLKDDEFEFIDT